MSLKNTTRSSSPSSAATPRASAVARRPLMLSLKPMNTSRAAIAPFGQVRHRPHGGRGVEPVPDARRSTSTTSSDRGNLRKAPADAVRAGVTRRLRRARRRAPCRSPRGGWGPAGTPAGAADVRPSCVPIHRSRCFSGAHRKWWPSCIACRTRSSVSVSQMPVSSAVEVGSAGAPARRAVGEHLQRLRVVEVVDQPRGRTRGTRRRRVATGAVRRPRPPPAHGA